MKFPSSIHKFIQRILLVSNLTQKYCFHLFKIYVVELYCQSGSPQLDWPCKCIRCLHIDVDLSTGTAKNQVLCELKCQSKRLKTKHTMTTDHVRLLVVGGFL